MVGTAGDSIKLPDEATYEGAEIFIYNNTATSLNIWPFEGGQIAGAGGVDMAVSLGSATFKRFKVYTPGVWLDVT